MKKDTCTVHGCPREQWAKLLCGLHYLRKWKTGSVELPTPRTAEERFWASVDKNGPLPSARPELGRCWVWTGYAMPSGYGFWQDKALKTTAHRFSFELAGRVIPAGLHVDHLCRNRVCVRAEHLEAVTQAENNRRAAEVREPIAKCKNGHEFSEENTYYAPRQRVCRTCRRSRIQAHRQRARAI